MGHDIDRIVSEALGTDDDYLSLVGRLTLLFSKIEDRFVHDALFLAETSCDENLKVDADPTKIAQLRIPEKVDSLKRGIKKIGRYYGLDYGRVSTVLNEFADIYRLRRVVVHGSIRWSMAEEKPMFVDSRSNTVRASHTDLADLNVKVLGWIQQYNTEMALLMRGVLRAYDGFADGLVRRAKSPEFQHLLRGLKRSPGPL
ncbi:MAG TPA: hypothetical protein VIY49_13195 [Bryobacteraceae bacterium]